MSETENRPTPRARVKKAPQPKTPPSKVATTGGVSFTPVTHINEAAVGGTIAEIIGLTSLNSFHTPTYCGGGYFAFSGFISNEDYQERVVKRGIGRNRETTNPPKKSGRLVKDLRAMMTQIYSAPHIYTSVQAKDLEEFREMFSGCELFEVTSGEYTVFCLSSEKIYNKILKMESEAKSEALRKAREMAVSAEAAR